MTATPTPVTAHPALGCRREELTTPALVLDLDAAERNIAAMAKRMAALPAALRPHVKVHKSTELARRQIEAGAIGVTTATVWEAEAMAEGGVDDVLVANQVVGASKERAAAQLAGRIRLTVAVDDVGNVDALAAAAREAGTVLGALVEVDTGMGRAGARSIAEAVALARHVARADGVELRGVVGYEGHCMLEPDRALRVAKAGAAMEHLVEAAQAIRDAGLEVPVVSAGGTGTWDLTGAHPGVTEIQAGSYVVMDAFHESLVPGFEVALTVMGTVISRHGDLVVLDVGRKAIGIDNMLPRLARSSAEPAFVHEEHSGFAVAPDSPLRVGDVVELESGYGPTTANLHSHYFVVRDGVVVDLWPVRARYGAQTTR